MRLAAKRDTNEKQIIDALEAVGAVVQQISDANALDLICGYRGHLHWLEVKDGSKPPSARKLTPGQIETFRRFNGYPLAVVTNPQEALEAIGAI